MALRTDRRSVLTGLGALGVMGCSRRTETAADVASPKSIAVDFAPLEARHGGRLGFTAQVPGGDRVDWRSSERFVYCSTFKMYLAAATLERVQRGEERLDRPVPVTAADMVSHAPVSEPAIGSSLTIETLCKAVVEVSDNPAANILIRELGGLDALRAWYRSIGDQSTTVDRLEPMMNRLDGDKDTITPAQSAANLERLFVSAETPLTAENETRLLRWMFDSPTGMDRIKAGVPAGWRVAHKTGTGGYGPTNDIGLAYPPSADPVVIAAYFHGTSDSTPEQRDTVIADATRMALAALGHGAAA
ncbi:class A beta-lactamase [Brevundimonas sp.]|uniref:class A beta-lactamase n=1 Tax=Brevundimonas sp. TaxID=1871086 RepID=UPI002D353895|nr:class A beta-lactamase [Brevundimonas sp.]HYC96771.1 class A beta-lactamase [Brevundimonas sp.]